ncbi:MAG: NADH-quinone oxidoreductase subunit L [Planctomycetota bacterium]
MSLDGTHVEMMLWLLLLPLAASVIQIFVGRYLPRRGDWLPTSAIGVSLALALMLFAAAMKEGSPALLMHTGRPPPGGEGFSWSWLLSSSEGGNFFISFLFDNLTAMMLVVVTLVSFLVHVFSLGYMRGDPKYPRFFAYLAFFSFSMLGLVLSSSFIFLFVCWELVGLSSYLLIGYWFEKPSAADACKKAFLTTRVGDVGMFVGMMILWWKFQTFDFLEIFEQAGRAVAANGGLPPAWMTLTGILIFMGPIGKSAQFPLHIWLPDAMEGPTPVSALIHAATMVVAGVYLVARMIPFFLFVPDAMLLIALVGAFTAIFAATIALAQFDIKKVLAYSTVSQLGFMMTALGCGALAAGTMHLMTHAWFKACLFLCSGSVIHGMHHDQDMRNMGGLRRKMPVTYLTMVISTMAIAGVPLLSGFYSKDAIVAATLHPVAGYESISGAHASGILWALPSILIPVAALMTAFYMFRLIIMTFHGEARSEHAEHAHESSFSMTMPLVALAVLAIFGASPWILNGDFLGHHIWYDSVVVNPVYEAATGVRFPAGAPEASHGVLPIIISLIVAGGGISLAFCFYQWNVFSPQKLVERIKPLHRVVYNKYFIDEFVLRFIVRPLVYRWNTWCAAFDKYVIDGMVDNSAYHTKRTSLGSGWFDRNIIDGSIETLGFATQVFGAIARIFQSGFLQHYLTWLAGSAAMGMIVFLFAF